MSTAIENQRLDSSLFEDFEGLAGIYELRRTLELEVKGKPVRIEVWYRHDNPNASWYGGVYTRPDASHGWKKWPEFPWVQSRDEESAIRDALDFLHNLA